MSLLRINELEAQLQRRDERIAELEAQLEAAGAGKEEPFGYVNTYTGQFFWTVEACPKGNEAHWRTVYTHPRQPKEGSAACILGTQRKPA